MGPGLERQTENCPLPSGRNGRHSLRPGWSGGHLIGARPGTAPVKQGAEIRDQGAEDWSQGAEDWSQGRALGCKAEQILRVNFESLICVSKLAGSRCLISDP